MRESVGDRNETCPPNRGKLTARLSCPRREQSQPNKNMPIYEVEITAKKTVCVKADDETEAEEIAADNAWTDSRVAEAEVLLEVSPEDEASTVKEYKEQGEYYK